MLFICFLILFYTQITNSMETEWPIIISKEPGIAHQVAAATDLGLFQTSGMTTISETAPIIVRDSSGNIAEITDFKTFEIAQLTSDLLHDPDYPMIFRKETLGKKKGFSVILPPPLTKPQIQFLLKLAQLERSPGGLNQAIRLHKLSLEGISRSDIVALKLHPDVEAQVNNILILETKDNLLLYVSKNMATEFFDTIKQFSEDNPESFTIPIPYVRKFAMSLLYNVARKSRGPNKVKAMQEIEKAIEENLDILERAYAQQLKEKKFVDIESKVKLYRRAVLQDILDAATWLGATPFILGACLDLYKANISVKEWENILAKNPHYKNAYAGFLEWKKPLETGHSVKWLIEAGNTSFFKKIRDMSKDMYEISMPTGLNSLNGLILLPGIHAVQDLIIRDTNGISSIKKGDFDGLDNITHLKLLNNKGLRLLEKNCFEGLPNLEYLEIEGNNIKSLRPFIFTFPRLKTLILENNNIKIIYPNWGMDMRNLESLTLMEKNKIEDISSGTIEWLNGLDNLKEIIIRPVGYKYYEHYYQLKEDAKKKNIRIIFKENY